MHSRRIATFFLGLWLGSSAFIVWAAVENVRAVNRLLADPTPAAALILKSVGTETARQLLLYQASHQNRAVFEQWGTLQLILGVGFFFFLLFATRERKLVLLLVLLMAVATALQLFLLTPELTFLNRLFGVSSAGGPSTRVLYGAYSAAELFKWVLGLILVGRWVRRSETPERSRNTRKNFDHVNKSDHGHVNR